MPELLEPPELDLDDLTPLMLPNVNHPSFSEVHGSDVESAGLGLVRAAVEAGFGELFSTRAAAEEALGGPVYPAPLGTVTKPREDGSLKHRLIQDLRTNRVNAAVTLPERLVLPRPVDLAADLADLQAAGGGMERDMRVGIVDFADAFMSIPLASSERRYNCAELPSGLRRARRPLHPGEPETGHLVVWRVLGFGGRPNPLVFGRVTSALMRAGQALLATRADRAAGHPPHQDDDSEPYLRATARLHLYVDDAAVLLAGSPGDVTESFDLLLLFWLLVGAPIAWPKVCLHPLGLAHPPCRWIGVLFDLPPAGARMRLPDDFVADLAAQIEELLASPGRIADSLLHQLCGRAARVAYVVPAATPFSAALRTALTDSRTTARTSRRKSQRSSHAAARFEVAGRWFAALLRGTAVGAAGRLELERVLVPGGPPRLVAGQCPAAVFDASPWGGGAVLYLGREPVEYIVTVWDEAFCQRFGAEIGDSGCLAFFEAVTALSAVQAWCVEGPHRHLALVGDNIAALTVALSFRGRGDLARVCREMALRQARLNLQLAVGHLPTEQNGIADALSRMAAPSPAALPAALASTPARAWPTVDSLFTI